VCRALVAGQIARASRLVRAGLVVAALLLAAPASGTAAVGALTPLGCISDITSPPGCGSTQEGLGGAFDVAVSPDGASVYVVSQFDDAIVWFAREAATGALTPLGCISDVGLSSCGSTAQGLGRPTGVAVSPDGASVYVVSDADDAIVRFTRNTVTGALTDAGCKEDQLKSNCGPGNVVHGLAVA
jgi:streptogramin lyase